MKTKLSLLMLAAIALTFSSCKDAVKTCKLGKYYITSGSNSVPANTLSYYEDGRLQKVVYTYGDMDTLSYNGDSIHISTYNQSGVLTTTFSGLLNSNGHVTTAVKTQYDAAGNVTGTANFVCQYNADGNPTQQDVNNGGNPRKHVYTYTTGNLTDLTIFTDTTVTERYIIYPGAAENKGNLHETTMGYIPYFGKPSKNLADSMLVIMGTDTAHAHLFHTVNNDGYVIKTTRTYVQPLWGTVYVSYSYIECVE